MNNDGFYSRKELLEIGFRQVGHGVRVSRKAAFYAFTGTIGDYSRIDDFAVLKGDVQLRRFVHISSFCSVSAVCGRVLFDDCAGLSCRVSVYTGSDDFRATALNNPTVPEEWKQVFTGGIVFGVGCLIGPHALVLPNAHIGDGASVEAFAIIYGSIPPGSIADPRRRSGLQTAGVRDVARIRALHGELTHRDRFGDQP